MPTTFEEIYNQFLSKIIDYDYLILTPEEKVILMSVRLKSALAKFRAKKRNIEADYILYEFNRELEYNDNIQQGSHEDDANNGKVKKERKSFIDFIKKFFD